MKQHNYWKLKLVLNNLIKIILWVFGIFVFILNLLSIWFDFSTISTLISMLSVLIVLIWTWFEKKGWKKAYINSHLPEDFWTPVIEGRWEGILTRDGMEHKFVVEIKQTFTSISCRTFSRHSHSSSIAAEILYNDNPSSHQFIYYWIGRTQNTGNKTSSTNSFNGFTILDINVSKNELVGTYFTDRQPKQTQGKLKLSFTQKELNNSFE